MEVLLLESVAEFLETSRIFRSQTPYETNIISSVAQSVADGTRSYDAYFWWVIREDSGEVTGVAMRTAPHGMLLSPMPDSAVRALAAEVAKFDDELSGVGGPREQVQKFAQAYGEAGSPGSLRSSEVAGQELLYALDVLIIPSTIGMMRIAQPSDFQLINDWFLAFGEEAGIYMHDPREAIEDGLKRKSLHLWIFDGEIVSLAGHAPIVDFPGGRVARIGPVYTPPEMRRRGYAGALTAALSEELENAGVRVMLYTDASNPTSNSVYQKIGYIKIGENERTIFVTQT